MSAFTIIKQEVQGDYYEVDGFKYTGTFPYEWAINHKWHQEYEDCGSGPKECLNCREYGTINNVFVLYCGNCKAYIYDALPEPKRSGLIDENCAQDIKSDAELWHKAPYMLGISLSQIGDTRLQEEQFVRERLPSKEGDEKYRTFLKQNESGWSARTRYWHYYFASENPVPEEEIVENKEEWEKEWEKEWPKEWQQAPDFYANLTNFPNQNTVVNYIEEEYEEFEEEEHDDYRSFEDDLENEAYDAENPITHYELSRLPRKMREAFNPKYKMCLDDFTTCMYDE